MFYRFLLQNLIFWSTLLLFNGESNAIFKISASADEAINSCRASYAGERKWYQQEQSCSNFPRRGYQKMAEEEKTGMMNKYFNYSEFKCRCGKNHPSPMNPDFIAKLTAMRAESPFPFVINSGFRCPMWNKHENGKSGSLHLIGRAADIVCYSSYCRSLLVISAHKHGMFGIGIGPDFVHVDDRKESEQEMWHYYAEEKK